MRTPWGESQTVRQIGAGIVQVSTASHGGFHVPRELLARIPKSEQAYARSWSGSASWYEEDCCALSVLVAFPEFFPTMTEERRAEYRAEVARYLAPRAPAPPTPAEREEESRKVWHARNNEPPAFDPQDCGGAFDGFSVTSDAGPGL
jgi:hypothetical protein